MYLGIIIELQYHDGIPFFLEYFILGFPYLQNFWKSATPVNQYSAQSRIFEFRNLEFCYFWIQESWILGILLFPFWNDVAVMEFYYFCYGILCSLFGKWPTEYM